MNSNDFFMTELGNAQRLVATHRDEMRYCPQLGKFLIRRDGRWRWDDTGTVMRWQKKLVREMWRLIPEITPELRQQMTKFCTDSEKANKIEAVIRLSQSDCVVTPDELDADAMILGTPTGAIDLRTGEFRKTTPDEMITKSVAVDPDDTAECPLWLSLFDRVQASNVEMIDYLQRIFGMCLTGDISTQEFWIFHGNGSNGKSTILNTIMGMMGDYAALAPPGLITAHNFDPHPTEIASTMGKRLIVASETETGIKLRTQLVKRFTGDATLKARFMRQDFFEFQRQFKLILMTNNKPVISEQTNAMWRRVRLVPFDVTISEAEWDLKLADKLKAEWPAILSWCVRGCLAWQSNGMQPPVAVLVATNAYKADSDALGDFIESRCILGDFARVSRPEVWAAYQSWAKTAGERNGHDDRSSLYEALRRIGNVQDAIWKAGGKVVRGFSGIALCLSSADQYSEVSP